MPSSTPGSDRIETQLDRHEPNPRQALPPAASSPQWTAPPLRRAPGQLSAFTRIARGRGVLPSPYAHRSGRSTPLLTGLCGSVYKCALALPDPVTRSPNAGLNRTATPLRRQRGRAGTRRSGKACDAWPKRALAAPARRPATAPHHLSAFRHHPLSLQRCTHAPPKRVRCRLPTSAWRAGLTMSAWRAPWAPRRRPRPRLQGLRLWPHRDRRPPRG